MNMPFIYSTCAIASYLLGAIPFAFLIARAKGVDIRKVGSGNIGATNVFRGVSKMLGILTFFLDAFKGFVPAFFFPLAVMKIYPDFPSNQLVPLQITCAFLAVCGHNWPVYLKFKGGKGVATSAGALLGIAPMAMLIGFAGWIVVFSITRYVSVGSIAAAVITPAVGWIQYHKNSGSMLIPVFLSIIAILVIVRHKSNIIRLMNGTENKIGAKNKTTPADGSTEKKN